jgi:hypothetical protein
MLGGSRIACPAAGGSTTRVPPWPSLEMAKLDDV